MFVDVFSVYLMICFLIAYPVATVQIPLHILRHLGKILVRLASSGPDVVQIVFLSFPNLFRTTAGGAHGQRYSRVSAGAEQARALAEDRRL